MPSSASRTTAAEVNCFASDPPSKMVDGVLEMACSRSAMPQARETTMSPATATESAHPGLCGESHWAKISSTRGSRFRRRLRTCGHDAGEEQQRRKGGKGGLDCHDGLLPADARSDPE